MELVAEEWEKGEKSEVTEDRTQGRRTMPMGHKAITKLQKLTIKPGWHTDAAIKPAGLPANRRIFLAFTTNHVATENVVCVFLSLYFSPTLSLSLSVFLEAFLSLERGFSVERKLHSDFTALLKTTL